VIAGKLMRRFKQPKLGLQSKSLADFHDNAWFGDPASSTAR
jgi:hypothetical protein